MSTMCVLKGINPADFVIKIKQIDTQSKSKYDIVNPGRISHTTGAGGTIRVLQRGELYNKHGNPYDRECGKACQWHRHAFDGLAMGDRKSVV